MTAFGLLVGDATLALIDVDADIRRLFLPPALNIDPDLGRAFPPGPDATLMGALARRHAGFELTERRLDAVGAALLLTLHARLGVRFTRDVVVAWTAAYRLLAAGLRAVRLSTGSLSHVP